MSTSEAPNEAPKETWTPPFDTSSTRANHEREEEASTSSQREMPDYASMSRSQLREELTKIRDAIRWNERYRKYGRNDPAPRLAQLHKYEAACVEAFNNSRFTVQGLRDVYWNRLRRFLFGQSPEEAEGIRPL